MDESTPRVLLATGRLIGEGFDHPPLDTLVLAMPVSWKGTLQQYAGRLHREHASQHDVRIHDYAEAGQPQLARMWDKRQRGYRAMGILDDAMHLQQAMPFIGSLSLDQVHTGTLAAFFNTRQSKGIKSKSINLALGVIRHMLNQAASEWLDEHGLTWLQAAPKIKLLKVRDAAVAYPLDFDEQRQLFIALPGHLERMALYKVNTGVREQDVCGLKWEWEVTVPELDTFVFVVPGDVVKNSEERLIVHNSVARSVIQEKRAQHPTGHLDQCVNHGGASCDCARTFVFTYKDLRIGKMNNSGWKKAWRAAGLPVCPEYKRGVHHLKHTFGRRLRAAGVPYETRQVLLGHKKGDITTHYSAAELEELIEAAERVCERNVHKTPTLTLLKRKTG